MDSINLNQIAPNRGVATTNYFNGRTLAAEDLRTDQLARQLQLGQLGRAVGAGVAYGLQVTGPVTGAGGASNSVTVAAGLAVNRRGRPLTLPSDVQVALTVSSPTAPAGAGLFADCQPPQSSPTVVSDGFYILTISPASSFDGTVPAVDLSGADPTLSGCGSRNLIEGVRFRLVALNVDQLPGVSSATVSRLNTLAALGDPVSLSLLRNLIAHVCFGTEAWLAWGAGLTSTLLTEPQDDPFGALGALRQAGQLVDCDVPLALIYWTQSGIGFVDRWAVRRALEPVRRELGFPVVASSGPPLARAVFSQFQEQVEDLAGLLPTTPALSSAALPALFAYLPAVGIVPASDFTSSFGFNVFTLFNADPTAQRTLVSLKDMIGLFRRADGYPPTVVGPSTLLQLYWVTDNILATTGQHYVVFATRELQGFLERDGIVQALHETWVVYSTLLKKAVLMPTSLTDAALPVWTALLTTQQLIVQFAMSRESAAAGRALDGPAVIETFGVLDQTVTSGFSGLYGLQKDLVQAAALTYQGDTEFSQRNNLTGLLGQYLDQTLPDKLPGLWPSISSANVAAILNAQQEINRLVGSWAGVVAFGTIQIQPSASGRGNLLKPGDAVPYPFSIAVTNQTDLRVTIALSAAVTAPQTPSQAWPTTLQIFDSPDSINPTSGPVITSLTLNSGEKHIVGLSVKVPSDAPIAQPPLVQAVTIALTAKLPSPSTASFTGVIPNLQTSSTTGNPSFNQLFIQAQPDPGAGNATPGSQLLFSFLSSYVQSQPPTSVTCTFTVAFSATGGPLSDWTYGIVGHPVPLPLPPTLSTSFQLPAAGNQGRQTTSVSITAPLAQSTTADKVLSMVVSLQTTYVDSTGTQVTLTPTPPTQTFPVTLKKTP